MKFPWFQFFTSLQSSVFHKSSFNGLLITTIVYGRFFIFFLFFIYVHDPFDESPRFTSLDDHDPYISPAHYFPTRLTHYSLLRTWPLFFFFFFQLLVFLLLVHAHGRQDKTIRLVCEYLPLPSIQITSELISHLFIFFYLQQLMTLIEIRQQRINKIGGVWNTYTHLLKFLKNIN